MQHYILMKEQVKSKPIHLLQFTQVKQGVFLLSSNLIGKMLGVKSVAIEFGIDGKRRWLRIKDLLQLQIERVEGADSNQESLIVNPPFSLYLVLTL